MKDTAPIGLGIVTVAGAFGIVGGGIALVLYDFSFFGGVLVAAIVASIVAVALMLGWRDPAPMKMHEPAPRKTVAPVAVAPSAPVAAKTPAATAAPVATAAPAVAEVAAAPAPEAPQEAASAASPGQKPATLSAPRDGSADDLKQIKGVGPKLEAMLNSMGFWHFDQVANWTAAEVAWVDDNLTGFKGRVSRDDWVAQAVILASGGTTEFSNKVKKGDVY